MSGLWYDSSMIVIDNTALRRHLQSATANVTFTKADGTSREMYCTLNFNLIPRGKWPRGSESTGVEPAQPNPAVLRVFDLYANDWRSFRLDSITHIELL